MFDTPTTPQGATSPAEAPQGNVEDIFADTEKAGAPGVGNAPDAVPPPPIESSGGIFGGKVLVSDQRVRPSRDSLSQSVSRKPT